MNVVLGHTIEQLRESAGLSQRKLAKKLGVSPSYLSRLERGERDPSMSFLRKLARATSAPVALLVGTALMSEVPEPQRSAYEDIFSKLSELAKARQMELDLNEGT